MSFFYPKAERCVFLKITAVFDFSFLRPLFPLAALLFFFLGVYDFLRQNRDEVGSTEEQPLDDLKAELDAVR